MHQPLSSIITEAEEGGQHQKIIKTSRYYFSVCDNPIVSLTIPLFPWRLSNTLERLQIYLFEVTDYYY